ncbi:MAG: hypothetical protein A3G33_10650 [Omnitrophica bacterium RIFCSPLOWO2_12_FULL_44_17]|uniref:PilZ domain-containing protein n=1 Tax=Candidatus Danuiimicrobium aquiferis TaxID=1801832 RepID=A0A1G1KRA2_9BACT|nr:MAG: hypothetical protein A3B72_02970 [Omnitrophica bacterium RIFCSPHIGHO2_02_FULL_45_28]OGW89500.1 MAG: hypothetical protein A3E74_06940 [Omnitrophica bacterium RIFCSPHIGHO2_12_FULL_44_12]OGW95428.1 MAG: hypothetical protein A3G33_10650 [Omnitrophica bacterium RIFCSPLOWO2_12_FULL_44_17]OGX03310.1 MAG: hypothetical protein A3J12_07285 [Omnitrophica bacterium RIFCSPLOWO2_02_FULL_44_11]
MANERRKFKRFDAYMNVKLRGQQGHEEEGAGLSKDLSREGMKVNTNHPIKMGTIVDLEIDLPDDPKPVRTTAKVMWTKPTQGEKHSFDYGVNFLLMDPVDKFRVLDYAYNYWLETNVNDFADPEEIQNID